MIGELIPGEILPGDAGTGDGGGGGSSFISAGKLSFFGPVARTPYSPGFLATRFGPVTRIRSARLTGFKATEFGPINRPSLRVSRLRGFKATKFSMGGLLPSYNPIRENWVRQLRGFKTTKFGG